jgi:hypothetical protein
MLEEGFEVIGAETGGGVLDLKGKDLYLVRLPSEFDVNALSGMKVELGSSSGEPMKRAISTSRGTYRMVSEPATLAENFRVVSSSGGGGSVGFRTSGQFKGCLSVQRDVDADLEEDWDGDGDSAITAADSEIIDNYAQKFQTRELMVHYMPVGCTSSMDAVRAHSGVSSSAGSSSMSAKKRRAEKADSGVGKSSEKKAKKEKKVKKDKTR